MDAKPWRIRLSPGWRRRHSHSNAYRDTNSNRNCHCNGDSYSDGNSDTDAGPEDYSLAETASNASAAAIADN